MAIQELGSHTEIVDFPDFSDLESFVTTQKRPVVVIQGLGFVGAAMAAAVSQASQSDGSPLYTVIGVELNSPDGRAKISAVNEGRAPLVSTDPKLSRAYESATERNNLRATADARAYELADIVVVDIPLDIHKSALGKAQEYDFSYEIFKKALTTVGKHIPEGCLVLVETTVPPGTTTKVVLPMLKQSFEARGLNPHRVLLAHSYERVMPGSKYLDSIINYYRVFAGIDEASATKARDFLSSFINTEKYPLQEMHSVEASEMAKVLENTFRATNIALIREWSQFAHQAGVNLFQVLDAIRVRPTHKNIMSPGFGVGGYCLTKDSLLADFAHKELFAGEDSLSMSLNAININDMMPLDTVNLVFEGIRRLDLRHPRVALLGVSYLNDVADTRYTPAGLFVEHLRARNLSVELHDPIVTYWPELDEEVKTDLKANVFSESEVVVVTVRHHEYLALTAEDYLGIFPNSKLIVDANNIVSDAIASSLSERGILILGVGKGHWA